MNIIGAFDRSRASELEPRANSVLICITSESSKHPKLNKKWLEILYLKFDDVEGREAEIGSAANVMQDKHAEQILDFAVKHIDKDLFINCDAGLSRSPGVLVALEQIFNGRDLSEDYRFHNKFVKNKIRDIWFKRIWFGREKDDEDAGEED